MSDLAGALRAELTKLWTLSGMRWLLAATAVTPVVVGAALAATLDTDRCHDGAACAVDPVRASLGGVWIAQIAACLLGVVAMSSEYDTAQIGATLAAMPRRLSVLVAKAGAVAALVAGAAMVGTIGSLAVGRLVLAGVDGPGRPEGDPLGWSLTDAATVRAALGTTAYLILVALLALGLAALLRDTAAAVAAVLGTLFLFPLLGLVLTDPAWQQRLQRWAPMNAGLAVQTTRGLDDLAIGPWAGIAVLAAYGIAAFIAGAARFVDGDA